VLLDDGRDPMPVGCLKLDNFSSVLPVKPVATSAKETREQWLTWLWTHGVQHEEPEHNGHGSTVPLTLDDQVLRKGI